VSPAAKIRIMYIERKLIHTFSADQIKEMLSHYDRTTFLGMRDYTILLILLDTGIRVS